MTTNAWKEATWIPLVFSLILAGLFPYHDLFEEWDGVMQCFVAKELVSGEGYHGWASHYWPPLHPLLLGVIGTSTSGFNAGKIVTMIPSVLLLYVAFFLALHLTNDRRIGFLTQAFVAASPRFARASLQVENYMLEAFLFCLALLLLLKLMRTPSLAMAFATGLVCGFAGLTRYTSYTLVPISILALGFGSDLKLSRRSLFNAAVYLLGFVSVSSPWWYYNTIHNGSPLHTWQYLNIGGGISARIPGKSWFWFQYHAQTDYHGLADLIRAMPGAYLKNVLKNLLENAQLLVLSTGTIAPFVLPATFESFLWARSRDCFIVYGTLVLFIGLVSQVLILPDVLVVWYVPLTLIGLTFLFRFSGALRMRYPRLNKFPLLPATLAILLVFNLALSAYRVVGYLRDKDDAGQLADHQAVTQALQEFDPEIKTKYLMAKHPARAYYAGSKFLIMPLYYEGDLGGIVNYEGASKKVIEFAPKYPSLLPEGALKADYFVYDAGARIDLPQFSFLLEPAPEGVPENFVEIYRSPRAVAYRIVRE